MIVFRVGKIEARDDVVVYTDCTTGRIEAATVVNCTNMSSEICRFDRSTTV